MTKRFGGQNLDDINDRIELTLRFGDLRQELLAGLVCLQLVNVLHQDALVLKHITLGPQVEAVVPGKEEKIHFKRCKDLSVTAVTIRASVTATHMCLSIFLDSL